LNLSDAIEAAERRPPSQAFTDLLRKHGRPATLKEALLASKNEKKLAGAKERVAISPQRASNRGRRGRAGKRIS